MRESLFDCGEESLNVATAGSGGPDILLFHGVTRRWQDWAALLPALSRRGRIHAIDHRGHGRSTRRTGRYCVRDYAADAAHYLRHHVGAPAVIIGHSLGAMVAGLVAARCPDLVQALILEDPPGSTLGSRVADSMFHLQFTGTRRLLEASHDAESLTRALASLPVRRPGDGAVVPFSEIRSLDMLRFGAECMLSMDPRVLDPLIDGRWYEGLDWIDEWRMISCPTLLLRGQPELGGMLDAREAGVIESRIARCRRLDLPGLGHNIHYSQPDQTVEWIARFLDGIPSDLPSTAAGA